MLIVITAVLSRLNDAATTQALSSQAKCVTCAEEVFNATRTVMSCKTERFETNRFSRHAFVAFLISRKQAVLNGVGEFVSEAVFSIVIVAVMYFAGQQVLKGEISVQTVVTYLLVVFDLIDEVESVPEALYLLSAGVGACRRIAAHIEAAKAEQSERNHRRQQAMQCVEPPAAQDLTVVLFEEVDF